MSRAGARALKEKRDREKRLRRAEEFFLKLEQDVRSDLQLVACESCGLEQVQPASPYPSAPGPPAGTFCVLCGNLTAVHVGTFQ